MSDETTPTRRKDSLPNYKWLQLPVDYLDDPDFNQLSDGAGFLFIRLYLIALKADAEGMVGNGRKMYAAKDLAFMFRKTESDVSNLLQDLQAAGFIEIKPNIRIIRFLDEQGPGSEEQRKLWRERQRKHRAKLNGENEETEPDQKNSEAQQSEANITVEVEDNNLTYIKGHEDVTVTSSQTRDTAATATSVCSSCGNSLTAFSDDYAVKAIVQAIEAKVGKLEDTTFAYRLAENVCNWYSFESGCECDIRRMELMALDELRCKECGGWKTITNEEAYCVIYDAIEKLYPDGDAELIQEVASDHTGNYEWWCADCDLDEWVKRGIRAYNALWEGQKLGEYPMAAFPDEYDRIERYIGTVHPLSNEELEKRYAEREAKAADQAGRDMTLLEWRDLQKRL